MNTTVTPNLYFSGYPLNWAETPRQKFPGLPLKTGEELKTRISTGKSIPATDVPENWDESWFANYE
ncbi:MAG: hypothetical protein M3Q06_10380 [Bacteroidota bacterium]|nr:hypothetical protein [Bacteroidota bacterium]